MMNSTQGGVVPATPQTAVAVQQPQAVVPARYGPPADVDFNDFKEALENVTLRVPKIKNPGSGSVFFTVLDSETDEEIAVKSIRGVVLHQYKSRSYYATPYTGGSDVTPPDCSCYNIKQGIGRGNPGGACISCPLNQFDDTTNRKECQERVVIYFLKEGEIFPSLLSVPAGSLRSWDDYVYRCTTRGKALKNVITEVHITSEVNKNNRSFNKMNFKAVGALTVEEKSFTDALASKFKSLVEEETEAFNAGKLDGDRRDNTQQVIPVQAQSYEQQLLAQQSVEPPPPPIPPQVAAQMIPQVPPPVQPAPPPQPVPQFATPVPQAMPQQVAQVAPPPPLPPEHPTPPRATPTAVSANAVTVEPVAIAPAPEVVAEVTTAPPEAVTSAPEVVEAVIIQTPQPVSVQAAVQATPAPTANIPAVDWSQYENLEDGDTLG